MSDRIGVMFVCLGNICRSPLARAVFEHRASALGVADRFEVDSCGTGHWHEGRGADPRSVRVAARHGIALMHVAKQFNAVRDLPRFRHLIAMDTQNVRDLISMGASSDRIRLLREFDPALAGVAGAALHVPDPYYGGPDGFEEVFRMIRDACDGLIPRLLAGA